MGGIYSAADLFAGPNNDKLADGNYYHGVVPDGKIVNPAGHSIQVGMNPLGAALTPDGKYLIVSNDDERNNGAVPALRASTGGYTISVVNCRHPARRVAPERHPGGGPDRRPVLTAKGAPVTVAVGKLFIGLQVTGTGPYTVYASGGGDNNIKLFTVTAAGVITQNGQNAVASGTTYTFVPQTIALTPITPQNAGFASNSSSAPASTPPSTRRPRLRPARPPTPPTAATRGRATSPRRCPAGGNGSRVVFPAGCGHPGPVPVRGLQRRQQRGRR